MEESGNSTPTSKYLETLILRGFPRYTFLETSIS